MRTETVQKQRKDHQAKLEDISEQLDTVADLLTKVLHEIKAEEAEIKLSSKAQKSIERGLKDLGAGNYRSYKDFGSFKKAFG